MKFPLVCAIYLVFLQGFVEAEDSFTFINPIRFPYGGPFQGIFVALALPLELDEIDVFVAINFEATYKLPENQTEFSYPPLLGDGSVDRRFVYNMLEYKLKSHGYPGKQCLLRAICEAAQFTTKDTGVLGDIIHIILTPSSSTNKNMTNDYSEAEEYGRNKEHCTKYNKKCNFSVLKLISWIGDIFH